eukprot:scaffold92362_cov29-Prasinocladus_malaysianus.AAC.2
MPGEASRVHSACGGRPQAPAALPAAGQRCVVPTVRHAGPSGAPHELSNSRFSFLFLNPKGSG